MIETLVTTENALYAAIIKTTVITMTGRQILAIAVTVVTTGMIDANLTTEIVIAIDKFAYRKQMKDLKNHHQVSEKTSITLALKTST